MRSPGSLGRIESRDIVVLGQQKVCVFERDGTCHDVLLHCAVIFARPVSSQ